MRLRSLTTLIVPALLLSLTAVAFAAATKTAAVKPASAPSVSGTYKATLEFKGMQSQAGQAPPTLGFSGKILSSGGKFRLELTNDASSEQQIYLMDGATKKAWMLFPDTLNGLTSDLASFDHDGILRHAQEFTSGGSGTPKDWGKATSATEQLGGRSVTHLTYNLPPRRDGSSAGQMHLYQAADQTPVRVVYDTMLMKISVDFSNFQRGAKLDAGLFTPDKKYKIRPLAAGETPPMPGGFGGGSGARTHGSHG